MGEKPKLTKAQWCALKKLDDDGFVMHHVGPGRMQYNRPYRRLEELFLADFDWGPKGCFLQTYGFTITDRGRAALQERPSHD